MKDRYKFFQRIGKTPIIPISAKILAIFITLILLSNFMTNFMSLQLSQKQIVNLTNTILIDRLKELYTNAGNQFQLASFSGNEEEAVKALKSCARKGFSLPNSLAFAIKRNGSMLFFERGENLPEWDSWNGKGEMLSFLNENFDSEFFEGSVKFDTPAGEYFGVYKYQDNWDCYLVRAELRSDTQEDTFRVLRLIVCVILVLTFSFLIVGILVFKHLFANLRKINESLYAMQAASRLSIIDLKGAPNDDITYLAASFNSLSSTINNLLGIFQKFVPKDVVSKAYSEHTVALEGRQKNLSVLFSDIKGFTYRTETLGNEIIDVLNVHYNRVIHEVHSHDGIIGSIIGDAVLAVFGVQHHQPEKSKLAIETAWEITNVTAALRKKMIERRAEIEQTRNLTEAEERVFKAVLLDVGVGIDGGTVFYGNIGSDEHMTNTVIGDNVNSASRLEGLTRVYHLPVIVSDFIRNETLEKTSRYHFYEIDTVFVKGKTQGMKIFFPYDSCTGDEELEGKFQIFEHGLRSYYDGDWSAARRLFKDSGLDVAQVFLERIGLKNAPADWSGIWTMTTK